jgi:hypothetical protein
MDEHIEWTDDLIDGKEVPQKLPAVIHFKTNAYQTSPAADAVLIRLAHELKKWLDDGSEINVNCEGYADPRGKEDYNLHLSHKRADWVKNRLQILLKDYPKCTITALGQGATKEKDPSGLLWAYDRRVNVFVKLADRIYIEQRDNPAKRWRANIFRNYHPNYSLWTQLGLDYLPDSFELVDNTSRWPDIRANDKDKVIQLIQKLAATDSDIMELYRMELMVDSPKPLNEVYWRVHEHEWRSEVYPRYHAQWNKYALAHPNASSDEVTEIVSSKRQ